MLTVEELLAGGGRVMDEGSRGFPPGDLRVSDADRERALSELSEAFRVGRITADEFDQRSGQALRLRTGKELTALLADLPLAGSPATFTAVPGGPNHAIAVRSSRRPVRATSPRRTHRDVRRCH